MSHTSAVFGEALFDLIEQDDGSLNAHIGGSPFNVARSFVRQGIRTTYVSPISTDRYGDRIYAYATKEGIHLPDKHRSDMLSSLAVVYTDDNGQPDYSLYRKQIADLDIDASTLLKVIPEDTSLFHTGSLALVPQMLSTLKTVFAQLKSRGVIISIDINMRKGVELDNTAYVEAVKALVVYADIVKVSDEDLLLLGIDLSPIEGAKYILSTLDTGLVVLTEGEHGATVLTDAVDIKKPVYPPTQFCDAVGAGDTFFSAFLANLQTKDALTERSDTTTLTHALSFALMAATLNVEQQGCQPPTKQSVEHALANR